jgi:tetratricopeptide (TPR) repeat protein
MRKIYTIFVWFVAVTSAVAQEADSLERKLENAFGSEKLYLLFDLCDNYSSDSPDKTLRYSQEALELSRYLGDSMLVMQSMHYKATAHLNSGSFKEALSGFEKVLSLSQQSGDKSKLADAHNSLGVVYDQLGNFDKSLRSYYESLVIYEQLNEESASETLELRMANARNNIGLVYYSLKKYDDAVAFFNEALKSYEKYAYKYGINLVVNNLGLVYDRLGDDERALRFFFRSLDLEKELGSQSGIAGSFNNIGTIYTKLTNYDEALRYYQEALKVYEQVGNQSGMAIAMSNMGKTYMALKKPEKSLHYQLKSLEIARAINAKYTIQESFKSLSETYESLKNYGEAYKYMRAYAEIKDTIFNEENALTIAELQTRYETDKKAKEIELLNKNRLLQQTEIKRQISVRNSFISGSVLVLIISFTVFNRFRIEKKAKTLLKTQNLEIMHQKEEIESQRDQIEEKSVHLQEAFDLIEAKNQHITDSINYARRIQDSLLPPVEKIYAALPESFVYYQPKDVVSGDFYWFGRHESTIILAVVDCTGHGVPGAIMSMMGHTLLNQFVNEKGINDPAEILTLLNKEIYKSLRSQSEGWKSRDGMEAAICTYHPYDNIVEFAGARSPLFMVRPNRELEVVPCDRSTLGADPDTVFERHTLFLKEPTMFFMSTDGYQDQFGGDKGKKFYLSHFKKLLQDVSRLPVKSQQEVLKENFDLWKGSQLQVDDVLVAGFRLSPMEVLDDIFLFDDPESQLI